MYTNKYRKEYRYRTVENYPHSKTVFFIIFIMPTFCPHHQFQKLFRRIYIYWGLLVDIYNSPKQNIIFSFHITCTVYVHSTIVAC